jgi:hypothetical protein
MSGNETIHQFNTVTMLVDRHNQQWQERISDHDLTPEQRLEYDIQIGYAVEGFGRIIGDKEPVKTHKDAYSRVKSFTAIDMGEFSFEGRMAHVYAQPTQHIFCSNGLSRYEIGFSVPNPQADLSSVIPYLDSSNATILERVSVSTEAMPLKSTLQAAYNFNQLLDQVAARS